MAVRRRLPPVEQIEAFVLAARSPNLRMAAEQLALSPSALTRRIQAFSGYVGHELFERCARGVRLTDAGRKCLEELEPTFLALREAALFVGGYGDEECEVKISVSHSLAVSWLYPRLARFRTENPKIELVVKIERSAIHVRNGEVDLGICHQGVDVSHLWAEALLDVSVTPVASPQLAAAFRAGECRLEDQNLLVSAQSGDSWGHWKHATGYPHALTPSTEFDLLHGMYEAAAHGLGVALGASPTVALHLEAGRLEPIGLDVARLAKGYSLVATASRLRLPHVNTVYQWFLKEGALTRDCLRAARPAVAEPVPA